jgi:hypothetical protein
LEETETFEGNDEEIIERPKAKKKLNIVQQVDDVHMKPRTHETYKPAQQNEFVMPTVTKKLKTLIPKGLDKEQTKKVLKKKAHAKIVEPRVSLPRPVWTSAGKTSSLNYFKQNNILKHFKEHSLKSQFNLINSSLLNISQSPQVLPLNSVSFPSKQSQRRQLQRTRKWNC